MKILAKTIHFSDDNKTVRYEIYTNDAHPPHYADSIIVYEEVEVNGFKVWHNNGAIISLDHLGFASDNYASGNLYYSRKGRHISSAESECRRHWEKNYR